MTGRVNGKQYYPGGWAVGTPTHPGNIVREGGADAQDVLPERVG